MDRDEFPSFATNALHAGQDPDQWSFRSIIPPLSMSTTFKQDTPGDLPPGAFEYSRSGNPTRNVLEACLASIDGAKHGICFASGLAATTTICNMLKSGDHILSVDDVYGGTNRYFQRVCSRFGITVTFTDMTDAIESIKAGIQPNTKILWLETPTNPLLKLVDIKVACETAKAINPDIIIVTDNTFASSYFQRPLDLGSDLTFHSVTKYMNGHTDVVMGAVSTNRDDLEKELRFLQNGVGTIPSPFDCYMVNRGMKTLHLRMREHMANATAVAKYLEGHELVEKVFYPGLPSHPQHELAVRQMKGFSGMVSFYIKGDAKEAGVFLRALKVFCLAESLGGYESLAEHPASMTHASVPADHRQKIGIHDNLIRLSVGIETQADLLADLGQALEASNQ